MQPKESMQLVHPDEQRELVTQTLLELSENPGMHRVQATKSAGLQTRHPSGQGTQPSGVYAYP